MQCPADICVVIELRVLNRGANTRARSQMRNRIKFLAMKQTSHRLTVAKLDVADSHVLGKASNIRVLDLWIVRIIEIVEDDDSMPGRKQLLDKVRADEARAACDQNSHEPKLATDEHRWT